MLAMLIGLGGAGGAAAQDHPPYMPTRDVAVEYKVKSGPDDAPQHIHMMFTAGGDRVRVEPPGMPGYSVIDRTAQRMMMVFPDRHAYMELPFDPEKRRSFAFNDSMKFTRKGTDTVAGVPCTIWTVQTEKTTGIACVSEDGVILRGQGAGENAGSSMEAVKVEYGPQPDSLFQPPADYKKVEMPAPPKQTP